MSIYRRVRQGPSYFFTVVMHDRQPILIAEEMRSALRNAIARVRVRAPFRIDAMVLLPDHLHCIWTLPVGDTDYPARWQMIKTIVTQCCRGNLEIVGMTAQGRSTLWQRRYWEHQIRDDDDFARHVDYIHINPLKHALVSRVADWPYSSFHRYVREGRLPIDWAGVVAIGKFGE